MLGTRHWQIIFLGITQVINHGMFFSVSVAMVSLTNKNSTDQSAKTFNWTPSEISYIALGYQVGYAVVQLPVGWASSFWNDRTVLAIANCVNGLIFLIIPVMTVSFGWVGTCFGKTLFGISTAFLPPTMSKLLARWSLLHERARMSSFISTGSALGNVFGMALSGFIAASVFGWPGIFYIFGAMSILWGLISLLLVINSPLDHPAMSENEKALYTNNNEDDRVKNEGYRPSVWKLLKSAPLWAIAIAQSGAQLATMTLTLQMPIYLNQILNYSVEKVGVIAALPYLSLWIMGFPCSWLADYMITNGFKVGVTRKIFNTIGMWFPALFLVILRFVDTRNPHIIIAIYVIAVTFKAGVHSGYIVNLIDLTPKFAGIAGNLAYALGTYTNFLSSLLWGWIIKDKGNVHEWHTVFLTSASIFFFTNVIYLFMSSGKIQPWNYPRNTYSVR